MVAWHKPFTIVVLSAALSACGGSSSGTSGNSSSHNIDNNSSSVTQNSSSVTHSSSQSTGSNTSSAASYSSSHSTGNNTSSTANSSESSTQSSTGTGGNNGAPLQVTLNQQALQAFPNDWKIPDRAQAESLKTSGPWMAYTAAGPGTHEETLTLSYLTDNHNGTIGFANAYEITLDPRILALQHIQFSLDSSIDGNVAWLVLNIGLRTNSTHPQNVREEEVLKIIRCQSEDNTFNCMALDSVVDSWPTANPEIFRGLSRARADLGFAIASSPTGNRLVISTGYNLPVDTTTPWNFTHAEVALNTCEFTSYAGDTLTCHARTSIISRDFNYHNRKPYISDAGVAYLVTNSESISNSNGNRDGIDLFMQNAGGTTTHIGYYKFDSAENLMSKNTTGQDYNFINGDFVFNRDNLRAQLLYSPNMNTSQQTGVVPLALLISRQYTTTINSESVNLTQLYQCDYAWSGGLTPAQSWANTCNLLSDSIVSSSLGDGLGISSRQPDLITRSSLSTVVHNTINSKSVFQLVYMGVFGDRDDNDEIIGATLAPVTASLEINSSFNNTTSITTAQLGQITGHTLLNENTYSRYSHTGANPQAAQDVRLLVSSADWHDWPEYILITPSYESEGILAARQRFDWENETISHSDVTLYPRVHDAGSSASATPDTLSDVRIPVSMLSNGTVVIWSREKVNGTDLWRYRTYRLEAL